MARIAWDNVSAPDFRGTADGLRDFASMWGGAMDSMGQGVKDFENAKGNQVSNQIQLALAQAPDAAAAQKLIQSGQVGGYDLNSGRIASLVDPNTIRALQDTPGNLIARASNQVKLQGDQRDFTQRANMDAQQAAIQSALTKSSSRDQATRDQGLAELGQLQANFGAGNFNNLLRDATSQGSSAVSTATSQNSLDQNQNGYNIDSIAAGIYQRARVASAGNPTDLASQLQRELANLDQSNPMYGRIAARINDLAGAGGGGMGGGGGLGGAGGGGAMASGGLSNLGLMTGGGSLPDSIKTVGDFVNQKDAILAAGRDKAGVGHTNTGVYQLGSDTVAQFAPASP